MGYHRRNCKRTALLALRLKTKDHSRDLKASNILLDKEMNPKISDFVMARIFNYRQDQANTIRVVGTYGYMAPEYAMEGRFSEKSDVYSFGVLIMEVVSGRKNVSFRGSEHGSLIGYAWNLWSQGKTKELIDPSMMDNRGRKRSDKMHPCGDVVYTRLGDLQTKHGFSFVDVGESNNQLPSTTKTAYLPFVLELQPDRERSGCCHCCWKMTNLTIYCSSPCS